MISISISSFSEGTGVPFTPARYDTFSIRTSKHGDSALHIVADVGEANALLLASSSDLRKILVMSDGVPIWRGVLADVTVEGDSVELVGLGHWSFVKSLLITGLWSHTLTDEWFEPSGLGAVFNNERYSTSNEGQLYIGLKSGETYLDPPQGAWIWEVPHGGINGIDEFSFTYDVSLPTGYRAQVLSANYDNSGKTSEWLLDGDGTQQTGSVNATGIGDRERLIFEVHRTSLTGAVYTDETDEFYAYIDALRIKSSASATIDTVEIAADILAQAAVENPNLFDGSLFAVAAGNDFQDVLYEDASGGDIIEGLEDAGDSASDEYLFNITRYNYPTLQKRTEAGRVWFADAIGLTVTSSLDGYFNRAYTRYQNITGLTRRTATADTTNDLAPGLIYGQFLDYRTTSEAESEAVRDANLAGAAVRAIKAKVTLSNVRGQTSDFNEKHFVRGGDRLIINGLYYNFQSPDRSLLYFDIVDATYDAVSDSLALTLGLGSDDQRDAIVEALTGEFDYIQI